MGVGHLFRTDIAFITSEEIEEIDSILRLHSQSEAKRHLVVGGGITTLLPSPSTSLILTSILVHNRPSFSVPSKIQLQ